MKLIKHTTIPASYCDADVKLSIIGAFQIIEDLVTEMMNDLHIDYCHHTNNISYIRFLMNHWSVNELSERPVKEMEVQYSGQTHEGDVLEIYECDEEKYVIRHGDADVMKCMVRR